MPKKINPEVKARAVRLVTEHRQEYPSVTAAGGGGVQAAGSGTGDGPAVDGAGRRRCRPSRRSHE